MSPIATHTSISPNGAASGEGSKASHDGSLSPSQLDKYRSDGYLVIPDFFDPTDILQHSRKIINSFNPKQHPLTKFSTGDSDNTSNGNGDESAAHVGNRYFLESGDKIRYFLEEGSVDQNGALNRSPELCVNKCGHALHVLDDHFHQLSFSSRVQNLIRSLDTFIDPQVLQSMIICKQPSIGGAVPSHNDSTFLYTQPPTATGLWFALEDCTRSNGCLSFLPGSHRWPKDDPTPPEIDTCKRPSNESSKIARQYGQLRGVNKRFVRTDPKNVDSGTSFDLLSRNEEVEDWDESRAVVEECKAGTLVLIHGSVLHKSEQNRSEKSRYIYTFHCIDGKAKYDEKNWLQPTSAMPFSSLYEPPPRPGQTS